MNKSALIALALMLGCATGLAQAAGDNTALSLSKLKPLSGGISQDAYALSDDIAVAEAQVQANPNDAEAHFLLAIAYSRTPYVEKALIELDRSRQLARKSQEGFALFDRKIAEYERMLQKSPDSPLVLYRLGFGYYMRGYAIDYGYMKDASHKPAAFYDKAEQIFRHLVSIAPTDISAKNYLGYLLAEREPDKNYDAAVELWQESIRLDTGNPAAYMLLGQAAMKKGNLRQAVEYSTMALKARNAWLEAHNINPANLKIRL
jgi:tetratricopeptide (TPR) repeat protein